MVTADTKEPQQGACNQRHIDRLVGAFLWETVARKGSGPTESWTPRTGAGTVFGQDRRVRCHFAQRFSVLLRSTWRHNEQHTRLNIMWLVSSTGQGVLFVELFGSVRRDVYVARSVANRVLLISFGAINMCMFMVMKTLDFFS